MKRLPLMYTDAADWFVLLTPPEHYTGEAAWVLERIPNTRSLLELGSGGGHLASHFGGVDEVVLSDLSPQMLESSKRLNPAREHVEGDMRTLRLGRSFDVVLIHDAIGYMLTEQDLDAAFTTAAAHLTPGGKVIVMPDVVEEKYSDATSHGGSDHEDGRGMRYLEWQFRSQDADATHYEVHYSLMLRSADGAVEVLHDQHQIGLFPSETWIDRLRAAGFEVEQEVDDWDRKVFIGTLEP